MVPRQMRDTVAPVPLKVRYSMVLLHILGFEIYLVKMGKFHVEINLDKRSMLVFGAGGAPPDVFQILGNSGQRGSCHEVVDAAQMVDGFYSEQVCNGWKTAPSFRRRPKLKEVVSTYLTTSSVLPEINTGSNPQGDT